MYNEVAYWIKFSFKRMRKEKATMPTIIGEVLEMTEFKDSKVTEENLRQGIKNKFLSEREKIMENVRQKLTSSISNSGQ
jgi:hypothetical protein